MNQAPQLLPTSLLAVCTASHFYRTYPHGKTTCRYPNQSRGSEHITLTQILANGLVGLYIISRWDGSAQEGVLRYPKRSGDQSRPRGIKLFWLWTVPSTMNNIMNNQDLKFSSPPKDYTSIGTILDPKLMIEDRKQTQTPIDPTMGLLHNHQQGKVIMTK